MKLAKPFLLFWIAGPDSKITVIRRQPRVSSSSHLNGLLLSHMSNQLGSLWNIAMNIDGPILRYVKKQGQPWFIIQANIQQTEVAFEVRHGHTHSQHCIAIISPSCYFYHFVHLLVAFLLILFPFYFALLLSLSLFLLLSFSFSLFPLFPLSLYSLLSFSSRH